MESSELSDQACSVLKSGYTSGKSFLKANATLNGFMFDRDDDDDDDLYERDEEDDDLFERDADDDM